MGIGGVKGSGPFIVWLGVRGGRLRGQVDLPQPRTKSLAVCLLEVKGETIHNVGTANAPTQSKRLRYLAC